jgi:phosphate transport system substrate-binding protein
MRLSRFAVVCLFAIVACQRTGTQGPPSSISGEITLFTSESVSSLVVREAEEFRRIYPEAHVAIHPTSTRDAIVQLLNDSVKTICIDRPLNEEERKVAVAARIPITENRFAEDALAVVVHPRNGVTELTMSLLKQILTRTLGEWRNVPQSGLAGPVEFVLTGRNSGTFEMLQKRFFNLGDRLQPAVLAGSQEEVLRYITDHPTAIGCVSLASLGTVPSNVRIVSIEQSVDSSAERFVQPSQSNLYHSLYPLHYSLYLYTAEPRGGLGAGFSTFVMRIQGQKILQDAGLVPASIPSRTIQITAE